MSISLDVLKKALPQKYRRGINDEVLNNINNTLADPEYYEVYRNNFLSYTHVLNDGKYKITDYLKAVKYVSHKLMGHTNIDSYIKTFPERYTDMVKRGLTSKDIASLVTAYNRNKLVNLIMEQTMIPSWVLNQDLYQKAINVLADLMVNAKSDKVKADSASSLLTHLKPPEVKKIELDIGLKGGSEIEKLRQTTVELASMQKRLIEAGVLNAQQVAQTKLITDYVDVEHHEVDTRYFNDDVTD